MSGLKCSGRLKERNYRFLRGIDPGFWSYQASVHAEHVHDPEEGQRAAGALRIVYGQGVEEGCWRSSHRLRKPPTSLWLDVRI